MRKTGIMFRVEVNGLRGKKELPYPRGSIEVFTLPPETNLFFLKKGKKRGWGQGETAF